MYADLINICDCKVIEKVLHLQLLEHVQSKIVLSNNQHGFLPQLSIEEWVGLVLLEFRKALDTVLYTLMKKLNFFPHIHHQSLNLALCSEINSYTDPLISVL